MNTQQNKVLDGLSPVKKKKIPMLTKEENMCKLESYQIMQIKIM